MNNINLQLFLKWETAIVSPSILIKTKETWIVWTSLWVSLWSKPSVIAESLHVHKTWAGYCNMHKRYTDYCGLYLRNCGYLGLYIRHAGYPHIYMKNAEYLRYAYKMICRLFRVLRNKILCLPMILWGLIIHGNLILFRAAYDSMTFQKLRSMYMR